VIGTRALTRFLTLQESHEPVPKVEKENEFAESLEDLLLLTIKRGDVKAVRDLIVKGANVYANFSGSGPHKNMEIVDHP
jgi:hypothetical protein